MQGPIFRHFLTTASGTWKPLWRMLGIPRKARSVWPVRRQAA